MVNIKGTRLYFLILGILEVLLSLVFVISTKIVLEKYSNGTEWYSLFYLYVSSAKIISCYFELICGHFLLISNKIYEIFCAPAGHMSSCISLLLDCTNPLFNLKQK